MGIHLEPQRVVRSLRLAPGFRVFELGDQYVTQPSVRPAVEFYNELGCGGYVSVDGNGRASLLADLNRPLGLDLKPFDLVTDFGTGEHIFDQAAVWRTVHSLCKIGGVICFDRPSGGYPGHCFYLTQRSLFVDIAKANGYKILALEERSTTRGTMVCGAFRRQRKGKFVVPMQGRYAKTLRPLPAL